MHSSIDPSTGKPYFQPQIISNKSRTNANTKIWESLYNTRFRKEEIVRQLLLKEKELFNENIPRISSKTLELFEEKKLNLIIQMFGLFDSDNDGFISVDKINLENVPKEFLKVLIPISLKIAEKSEGISIEEFYREFIKVYKSLTPEEKAELFKRSSEIAGNFKKEWKEEEKEEQEIMMTEPNFSNFKEKNEQEIKDYSNTY